MALHKDFPKDKVAVLDPEIRGLSKVHETRKGVKESVFDMTKQISAGRGAEALQILNRLYDDGAHPLMIMGGVVWALGNERGRV